MRTIDAVRRSGVGMRPEQTVREAARSMEGAGVGSLAVLEGDQLVGIVTDRDLVRRVLARGIPLETRVDAIMSSPVVSVEADADLHEAFGLFGEHPIRRLAVMRDSRFVGMLTVDDLLVELARGLADLSQPVVAEMEHAHRDSFSPVTV